MEIDKILNNCYGSSKIKYKSASIEETTTFQADPVHSCTLTTDTNSYANQWTESVKPNSEIDICWPFLYGGYNSDWSSTPNSINHITENPSQLDHLLASHETSATLTGDAMNTGINKTMSVQVTPSNCAHDILDSTDFCTSSSVSVGFGTSRAFTTVIGIDKAKTGSSTQKKSTRFKNAQTTWINNNHSPSVAALSPTSTENVSTRRTTCMLRAWLREHKTNPYPTKGEKIMLAVITEMSLTQISTWFANARRRLKKENQLCWNKRGRPPNDSGEKRTHIQNNDCLVSVDEQYYVPNTYPLQCANNLDKQPLLQRSSEITMGKTGTCTDTGSEYFNSKSTTECKWISVDQTMNLLPTAEPSSLSSAVSDTYGALLGKNHLDIPNNCTQNTLFLPHPRILWEDCSLGHEVQTPQASTHFNQISTRNTLMQFYQMILNHHIFNRSCSK